MAHFIYPQATSTTAFLLDSVIVSPTVDSAVPTNNKGMPVVNLAGEGLGPLSVNTGAADATTLRVVLTSDSTISIEEDKNWGTVGANTIRTAAQIGNATGAAEFGTGADSAQTLRVTLSTRAETAATPLSVRLSDGSAFLSNLPVSQSGTWNLNNISGTISLPTGAATESTLSSISGKLPATLGQKPMADSLAVVLASDQSTLPVSGTVTVTQATAANLNATVVGTGTFAVQAAQSGTWNLNNITGTISLPTGAATESTLSALSGKVANDYGVSTGAVRTASQIGNTTGAAAFGAGASSGQTLRVVLADESKVPVLNVVSFIRNDYSTTPVTTGAYVELVASAGTAVKEIEIFDSSGESLVLALGAAGAEVNKAYVFPGGNGRIPVQISAGQRLSIKAVSASATSGELLINFYG